jgi:hypothetical protein
LAHRWQRHLEDGKVGAANRRQSHSDESVGQRNDAGLDRDRDKVRSGQLAPHSLGACRAETTQLARGAPVGAKWVWILPSVKPNLSADDFRSLSLLARHIR